MANKLSLGVSILALLLSIILFSVKGNDNAKIAYVDINKVIANYQRTKRIKKEYQLEVKKFTKNRDSLLEELKIQWKEFERIKDGMSKNKRQDKQAQLNSKKEQLNNYSQSVQKKLQEKDKENMRILVGDVNEYLKDYGDLNNYDIILGANGSGNIMYGSKTKDITEEVIKNLNHYKDPS